jgi:flagellar biosynthetic protein FliO
MVRYRKKIVVFLITVTLGSGVLLVCSARSANDGTKLENSPVLASPQVRAKSKAGSLFANDPNFSDRPDGSAGNQELFFKMMLSVLFVVALGAAAIYVSKKFLPKITNLPGKEIRVVETVHLGPRKAVHLLEIGNQRLLIGSTNENITRLADLTTAFTDLSAQEEPHLVGTRIDNN